MAKVIAVCVLVVAVWLQAYAQPQTNFVSNPGFEAGTEGWDFHDHSDGTAALAVIPGGHSETQAAKLTMTNTTPGVNACVEQTVKSEELGGKTYRFSLWAKCDDSQIHYDFGYVYEVDSKVHHWIAPEEWKGDWAEYSTSFKSDPGTTSFAVGVYIRHAGAVLVDDFCLQEVVETTGQ